MTKKQQKMCDDIAFSFAKREPEEDNHTSSERYQWMALMNDISINLRGSIPGFDKNNFIRKCYFEYYK